MSSAASPPMNCGISACCTSCMVTLTLPEKIGPRIDVGIAVDRLLHLRAGDAGIGLGVSSVERDLLLEDAALGVDLLDRQDDAVAEIAAGHRDAARYLADIGELHLGFGDTRRQQRVDSASTDFESRMRVSRG